MKFVFWQNIISIHQKDFLEALSRQPGVDGVMLVVEHELTPLRKDMGWSVPELAGVGLVVSPGDMRVKEIIAANKDAVHIMGGIRIGQMITTAFDLCVAEGCKLGVMTEPYDDAGLKGAMRVLKYRYYGARYFRHIQFVLAIGKQAMRQYAHLGYNTQHLFGWAYFITLNTAQHSTVDDGKVKIIYAGRLDYAKGIHRFVKELADVSQDFLLDIFGTGPYEDEINTLVAEKGLAGKVRLITGFIKHEDLLEKYSGYNWVVLPSLGKDGWGVIVSEGLLSGLKVICSSKCGASWVIRDGFNGVIFDWRENGSCNRAINKMCSEKGFADAAAISTWAERTISGEAGARYFMQIIDCVYNKKSKPGQPWA